jgi:hypothetical protein
MVPLAWSELPDFFRQMGGGYAKDGSPSRTDVVDSDSGVYYDDSVHLAEHEQHMGTGTETFGPRLWLKCESARAWQPDPVFGLIHVPVKMPTHSVASELHK